MRYLENVNVDGRILLKWILNGAGRYELDQSSSGQGQVAHSCEMSCESSVLLKDEEFLDYLSNNWLFKKDSTLSYLQFVIAVELNVMDCLIETSETRMIYILNSTYFLTHKYGVIYM